MLIFSVPLTKNEGVVEKYDLSIDILNCDQEAFGIAMDLLIPTEIGDYGEIDTKKGACDRLNLSL